jgi:hypothetical protein
MGVLDNIPGLGAFLAMQDRQRQNALGDLQGVIGLGQAVRQQQAADVQAQLAPLQIAEARRKDKQAQEIDAAIDALPEGERALARLAPQQYVASKNKDPLQGLPEIGKLQAYERQLRSLGRVTEADQVLKVIENKELGGTSQVERSFRTMSTLQNKVNAGQQLTPEEEQQAQVARAVLSQQQMRIDPQTNQPYWTQPITIPQMFTVGSGQPAQPASATAPPAVPGRLPPNTLPAPNNGRKGIELAAEKEINQMGDQLSIVNDLNRNFDPKFAGWKFDLAANVAQEVGRRFGDEAMQKSSRFWELYNQWVIDIRNSKFGATLTGNELKAFEAIIAKPSQTPEMVKNNLARQQSILERAMARRMNSQVQQGVNPDAIDAAAGFNTQRPSSFVNATPQQKQVKRTGTLNGQRVIEYTDGTIEVK